MGWGSAGEIFDLAARGLIKSSATEEVKREVLGALIDKLRDDDWDTCEESLEEFRDDPVVVRLFAERDITMDCQEENPVTGSECVRRLGHSGDHVNDNDDSWPRHDDLRVPREEFRGWLCRRSNSWLDTNWMNIRERIIREFDADYPLGGS